MLKYTSSPKTFRRAALRLALERLENRATPAQFLVTTTADNGSNEFPTDGSLRQGIKFLNAGTNGVTDIFFGLPPGSVITPNGVLPGITRSNCAIVAAPPTGGIGVRIHGANAFSQPCLAIAGSFVTVRGLSITGFSEAIRIDGSNCTIQSNFIGVDYGGMSAIGNGAGITINGDSNLIGGLAPGNSNVISGNATVGIEIKSNPAGTVTADNNKIYGNRIGVSPDFAIAIPNGTHGIRVDRGSGTVIGADDAADGALDGKSVGANIIGNNGGYGIDVIGPTATFTAIQGNVILGNALDGIHATDVPGLLIGGTSALAGNMIGLNKGSGIKIDGAGMLPPMASGAVIQQNRVGIDQFDSAIPNGKAGVHLFASARNTVGGTTPGERNLISANLGAGIAVAGSTAIGNVLTGNFIGTASDGETARGNMMEGVFINGGASQNRIGGPATGEGNVIAYNGEFAKLKGHGVLVDSGTRNTISRNSIFSNFGRGIDLRRTPNVDDGFTVNDTYVDQVSRDGDPDVGANDLQDYPVVIGRSPGASHQGVHTWRLSSKPNADYTIEFFANTAIDSSGFGEGRVFLSSVSVTTDAFGLRDVPFDHAGKTFVSATATDSDGNTSEFSMIDTDADGLADAWESVGIDINEDGNLDLILNSAPGHRDIFVEVDVMKNVYDMAKVTSALGQVVTAFADVNNSLIHNPEGGNGITLHAAIDAISDIEIARSSFGLNHWAQFEAVKEGAANGDGRDGHFGSAAERDPMNENWANVRAARRLVYRYCLFADEYAYNVATPAVPPNPPIPKYGSSGVAELGRVGDSKAGPSFGGNDFMVTLGIGWNPAVLTVRDIASTFMHEMGHTLNIRHGGADNVNYKPNYHSVMNYSWQIPRLTLNRLDAAEDILYEASFRLDYSRQAFDPLDEAALNEVAGITGLGVFGFIYGGKSAPYGTKADAEAGQASMTTYGARTDWNQMKGDAENPVSADINFDGKTSALIGHEDWSGLQYYFAEARFTVPGNHVEAGDEDADDHLHDVAPPAPRVANVTVHDGSAQRSRVTSITVDFDDIVSLPTNPADAFQLVRQSDNLAVALAASIVTDIHTHVILTFTGGPVEFTSLADGRYTLTVSGGSVSSSGGSLDGNGDGTGGDNYTLVGDPATNRLFRLFGDADGSGQVTSADFLALRLAFLGNGPAFDFDADGQVDGNDLLQFRLRFLQSV